MLNQVPIEKQSDGPALPRLAYTMAETAQMLGLSYMSVFRLYQAGLIKSCSPLRKKLFTPEEINRFRTTPQ